MTIIERIKVLNFPADQFVVIGSGILDAYGLREANDIDLIVPESFFQSLKSTGVYQQGILNNSPYLRDGDLEVWLEWYSGNNFARLKESNVMIDGIMFVDPQFLIERKRERGSKKDIKDIQLLERYLDGRR